MRFDSFVQAAGRAPSAGKKECTSLDKRLIINKSWCKGCGICVAFCPKEALELRGGKAALKADGGCVLCGLCEQRCPDFAIFLEETEAEGK